MSDVEHVDADADASFEHLARAAGEALRAPAPDDVLRRIVVRGKRQQNTTRVALAGLAVVIAVTSGLLLSRSDRADLPTPSNTTTPVPPRPWIAYTINQPSGYGIRLVHADGTADQPALSALPRGTAEHPDWSPDGRRMVFSLTEATGDGSKDLWVADVPGAARRLVDCVVPCQWVDEASWSPDGARIAYQRGVEVNGRLVSTLEVIDLSTSSSRVLLTAPPTTVYLAPRWSPDGQRMVVETARIPEDTIAADPNGDGVGVVELDHLDQGIRMLTDLDHFAQNPDWSWTTNRISFAARSVDGASETDIFTIAPDGTDQVQVTRLAVIHGLARFPTFSRDGSRIMFALLPDDSRGHSLKIASVASDGSDLRTAVGTDFVVGEQPRVQPDP
jgi:Tol biopolymer transport system component